MNGNLVMFPVEDPDQFDYIYWRSRTAYAGGNVKLNFDKNGLLYLLDTNGKNIRNLSNSITIFGKAMYRATIDADGIFRLYSHNLNGHSNWTVEWQSSDNKCDPTGLCGSNAYCTLVDQVAVCACPPGFEFIDQSQKNLGCRPNSSADDCTNTRESGFAFEELEGISWESKPYSTLPSATKEACRDECLKDCYCEAAVYRNQQCRKHILPLRFGKAQGNPSMTTFIKAKVADLGMKTGGSNRKNELRTRGILIACIAVSTLALLALVIFGILFYRYRVWNYKKVINHGNDELLDDVILRSFTYDELKKATNKFEDEIGRGAFGTVFRGVISNGNRVVAIKRLEKVVAEGEREFLNEMKVIGRTHHKNLVRLLGYCHDGTNRLLVYEYMCNGSLADFLFRSGQKPAWEERNEMALNIARGIVYLHEECETQIIHCDIKPENILMDEKESAKIADFGLSKLLMPNQSRTYTGIRGTRGYVAPEWHTNLPITVKVDVYSFGIMLLEIICCRRNVDMHVPDDQVVLANWVYDCFEANQLDQLIQDEEVEESKLEKLVKVGLWCIQDEPSSRPSMKKVVLMLEGTIDTPDPPSPPSFSNSNNDITCT
ncbi:G-type lectin S-receptor-like serine/threonine-protein kinase LECRK3 [Manihot esculenta]|uniref:non-specific serine/threonine protein kinase n=1 Tax=Manihot esculenta TaxID=3983 RepID=A0A2C9WEY1_MANES|nr:G-type lectin S-receptor-like serine/threonine-protein kinase LECRK3 [Manihot esculenta]